MKGTEPRLPDLLLEQYALGELDSLERARVDARLAADPSLRERLEALRRSDEEILAEAPPAEIAASIRRRMLVFGEASASSGKGRLRVGYGLAFPAAAAVLVLVGAVMAKGLLFPARGEELRAKSGAPGLSIYKKAASGPLRLADGDLVAAGDVLQIKYAAAGERYGAIVSLDGKGSLTWHLPGEVAPTAAGERAGPAPRMDEKGAALNSAYELDDAPSFERFFILSSREDFDLSLASKALGDLARSGAPDTGALHLPSGLEYKSLLLRKAAR